MEGLYWIILAMFAVLASEIVGNRRLIGSLVGDIEC